MTTSPEQNGLHHYLAIERRLLAHRAMRWFRGLLGEDEEAEERFFDELETAATQLTVAERAALREIVLSRATIRPGDGGLVDVAIRVQSGGAPRRMTRATG